MIAITSREGALIRTFPAACGIFGFHDRLGIVSEQAAKEREKSRKRHGLKSGSAWGFQFRLEQKENHTLVEAVANCKVQALASGGWALQTALGTYQLSHSPDAPVERLFIATEKREKLWRYAFPFALLAAFLFHWFPTEKLDRTETKPPLIEPVTVKVVSEPKRVVIVAPTQLPTIPSLKNQETARVAVQQNLGFLGLLGKKDLAKALGGMPSTIGPTTPGAGPGGKGGSGGELLVGLGQGVKRTTVGNTGVQGLGGMGDGTGPGGGAGGYGDSLVASGHGRALSQLGAARNVIALSKDIELEGGLDRTVIQATIAKYISQVRACYERGLEKNPGLVGKISMEFEVGALGKLNYARVGRSSLGNNDVENCIAGHMLDWLFPKPLGGVSVKVTYPFLLRPSNS